MDKFRNKYRIDSHRMPGWNYAGNGNYFITLITQHRECNLGEIIKGKMHLSDYGEIVKDEWNKSFVIRKELHLDEYIIMPNHLHAIVILKELIQNFDTPGTNRMFPFLRKSKSLSSFIAGFKSAVNSEIDDYIDDQKIDIPKYNRNNHFFQPNYHDRIIRNKEEYRRIKQYIKNNPGTWADDCLNTDKFTE